MSETPKTLHQGRYEIREVLGEGGMAIVYRAWDHRLRVERAIKLLSPEIAQRVSLRQRFEIEARTMAGLAHPNIVSVTDVAEDEGHFFMVMELVTGGTLWEWVQRHGPMPPRLAAEDIRPILDALSVAHAAGVVHRDIKPQNIMLTAQGVPKIADFGIAHVQNRINTGNLTKTGSVIGTWGYMAPEQRQSSRGVDPRSDLYALGATLYALSTADLPVDLFAAAQDEDVLGGMPSELHDVVRKATRYRPQHRYQSAQEMAAAVDDLLARLPPLPAGVPRIGRDVTAPLPPRDPDLSLDPIDAKPAASTNDPQPTYDFDRSVAQEALPPVAAPATSPSQPTPPFGTRPTAIPYDSRSDSPQSAPGPEPSAAWRRPGLLLAAGVLALALPAAWYALGEPTDAQTDLSAPKPPTPSVAEPVAAEVPDAPASKALMTPSPEVEPAEAPIVPSPDTPRAAPERRGTAAPTPTPRGAQPEPATTAVPVADVPTPALTPAAAAPSPARVSVQGEVDELRLIDVDGKLWPPGSLPCIPLIASAISQ